MDGAEKRRSLFAASSFLLARFPLGNVKERKKCAIPEPLIQPDRQRNAYSSRHGKGEGGSFFVCVSEMVVMCPCCLIIFISTLRLGCGVSGDKQL